MECPECHEKMEPFCMSGNNEEIEVDYNCPKCNTLAFLKWFPYKSEIMENENTAL